jgi:hypothetical protein
MRYFACSFNGDDRFVIVPHNVVATKEADVAYNQSDERVTFSFYFHSRFCTILH